ncbi:nestin [Etheostoma cragini]|uniref:nestin n=1 Tax=Etheostoma cragini TaxID=417921 RepID=UPI00155E4B4F|nr:nestin [Etheostoma cragini]
MEFHSVHQNVHHSHLGKEKHQMLDLNRRLGSYLSRVKLLEEENATLAKEIQDLQRSDHGASTRRQGLEEELRRARLEVDAAWRDRVHTEMEVRRVTEELQALDLQRRMEAQARAEAKKKIEQSKKELEEEQRAQIWLRERVNQLEDEMRHLIQTHQEDVAHLEATQLTQSRATMPSTSAQRGKQTPNLQELGQEYSQRANRAWQEAAEAHQGQLERLEKSLNQARSRLTQANQEKRESQLKLQTLEKEMASAQDVRLHLEETAARQGDRYSQEIQQLQEHLESLEGEKEELGQRIHHVVLENRGLLQQKTSLGLEVATYRALLDNEGLGEEIPLLNKPRTITDAVFSPWGVQKNYQTQLSASHKTTSLSSVRGKSGRGPTVITTTPMWSRKPVVTITETPKNSTKPTYEYATKTATWEPPYPKILQDGAVENFRPQEVHEKVTYAEPLSPPGEQEVGTTSGDKGNEENQNNVGVKPPEERSIVESVVGYQVESGLSNEPPLNYEDSQHQLTTPYLSPYHVRMREEPCGFSDDSDKDVPFEIPAEKEELHAPVDAWVEKEWRGKEVGHVQEETSDSETEAVIEPNFDSRTNSPVSECEPEESLFNKVADFNREENILKEDAVEMRQEKGSFIVGTNETDDEDKLYPDGEEMDTWDSVIERRVDVKTDEGIEKDEEKRQHAEPEEDISAREQEHGEKQTRQDVVTDVEQHDNGASSMTDTQEDDDDGQHAALEQGHAQFPDNGEDDEEEDSQNVSVSWRTELESDSYAQDNTLADPRPLIRYKSDETDANTQASHVDESESSEGEQEKKTGEMGMWSEAKSTRFGTMEDLCEEVEAEVLDNEYNLGYTHIEDSDVVQNVSDGHSDEETEEPPKPIVPSNVYNDELETDRLVEQELENLATDIYSAHFAQQQVKEIKEMKHMSPEEMTEQEEAGMSSCEEPEMGVNHQLASSTTVDQHFENQHLSDLSSIAPRADAPADDEVQHKDQEAEDAQEKREEEDPPNVSMVTHADGTEDLYGFTDFTGRSDMEETNNSKDPNSVLQVMADEENLQDVAPTTKVKEVAPEEATSESQEHLIEDNADCRELQDVLEKAEWEVLENPSEDFGGIRDPNVECDHAPKSVESYIHNDGGADEVITTGKEEPLEIPPDSVPDENDIFLAKVSTEQLNMNGKDNGLHSFFSSGLKNDFWLSSLETGATHQPIEACNDAAEQTNQNLDFADNAVWGDSENVVNWNSRGVIDSSEAQPVKKEQEQMHSEVKQVFCRNVEGESVHSDESDVEGKSWSSGEEPV